MRLNIKDTKICLIFPTFAQVSLLSPLVTPRTLRVSHICSQGKSALTSGVSLRRLIIRTYSVPIGQMSEFLASDWSLCSLSADITLCVWPHMVTVRSQEITIPPETAQSVTSRVTVTMSTTQAVSHLGADLHDNTKCSQTFSLQRHFQHL